MNILNIEENIFLVDTYKDGVFVFSTADNNLNINIKNIHQIESTLKKIFKLNSIAYAEQIHSNIVLDIKKHLQQGDALITNESKTAVGVFTADCVPILIYDHHKKVASAVHSGWKGTFNNILSETINKMIEGYRCSKENMIIYIGPHIRKCCYEVGDELKERFLNKGYSEDVFTANYLDLNKCIKDEMWKIGIKPSQVLEAPYCTKCSMEYKFHSYRRDDAESGRNFSFMFFK